MVRSLACFGWVEPIRRVINALNWPLLIAVATITLSPSWATAQPVIFRVGTDTGNDTLYVNNPSSIIFTIDPNGTEVAAFTFPLLFHYSNVNFIGVIRYGHELLFPPFFEQCDFDCFRPDPSKGTNPDTLLWGWIGFGGPTFDTLAEVARIVFVPTDTGSLTIDSTKLPPANQLSAVDDVANDLPIDWQAPTITVVYPPCPVILSGDSYRDGTIDVRDILYFVQYIWKSGPPPLPCPATGDVNCDGVVNAQDLVYMLNYVFMSGSPPCNVCPLVWSGTWECP